MSKSPNILLPALGGAGLVMGGAFAIANVGYGSSEIALLQDRAAQLETTATASAAKVSEAAAQAKAEAARAAELAAQVTELKAAPASLTAPAPQRDGTFGLGRDALAEEIAAWDVDILPDGRGLPVGSGDAITGEEVFYDYCASCHGDFAEGVDNWPVLAGGFDTLGDKDPVKTVGSYWPHLSTVWDYVNRSMPFGAAGTLTPDEVYAITAYILYSNDLVADDFVLSNENFGAFEMYNKDGFVIDDRPDLEYTEWRAEPCMENCKDSVKVTMRSVFLVQTPPEGGSESVMNHATIDGLPSFTAAGPSHIPAAATPQPVAAPEAKPEPKPEPAVAASGDDALIKAGQKVFSKCKSCHQIGDGAKNRSGPILTGVMDSPMGAVDGFKYSDGIKAAAAEGRTWSDAEMAGFLAKPKAYMKGTRMSFPGLKTDEDIAAVIAYLRSMGG
ncbi:MAG: c-type cytochrome [Pseudomonadota bacterium]